jgi:hypothetical protein
LERTEDVLRKDPRTSLTILAEGTGGFLVDNTNDLARGLQSIDTDRRFHYLLTYTPKNLDFNGEWRKIEVRVPLRRRVTVRSRSGYLAVRTPPGMLLRSHEGPALAALDASPPPAAIPLRPAALAFPTSTGTMIGVLAAVSNDALAFQAGEDGFRAELTVLTVIRDQEGIVVRKASQPYQLAGPHDQLANARAGEILFFRQPVLPPASYTLHAVAYDPLSRRAGVSRVPFTIPGPSPSGIEAGSLTLFARVERYTPDAPDAAPNPFVIDDALIHPNLGEPFRKSPGATLGFLIAVRVPDDVRPAARLEVMQGGRPLAELPLQIDAPDPDGIVRPTGRLPLDPFPPGTYTLRVSLESGTERIVREAPFTVESAEASRPGNPAPDARREQ